MQSENAEPFRAQQSRCKPPTATPTTDPVRHIHGRSNATGAGDFQPVWMLLIPLGEEFFPDAQAEPPVRPFRPVACGVGAAPAVPDHHGTINPSRILLFCREPPLVTSERHAGRGHDVTARRAAPQCGRWDVRSPGIHLRTSGLTCAPLRAHLRSPALPCAMVRFGLTVVRQ